MASPRIGKEATALLTLIYVSSKRASTLPHQVMNEVAGVGNENLGFVEEHT